MNNIKKSENPIINKLMVDWVLALVFAILGALIFRTWFYEPFKVPTSSMVHTIEVGDHVFVSKFHYGFYIPFTAKKWFPKKTERGDIVVFPYPLDPKIDYIKRVIGVGGDEIKIIGETVYVNGVKEKTAFLYFDPALLSLPENLKTVVPAGKLWVMGDNRRNSKDSRYWGFVDEATIEGKAKIIFWSHETDKNLIEGYHFERIGNSLELTSEPK